MEVGKQVKVSDLLYGVIIQSGNDAAIAIAEGISGTEEGFAEEMNYVARQLGMENTVFKNATGWPDPDQHTTARDLNILATALIEIFHQTSTLICTRFLQNRILPITGSSRATVIRWYMGRRVQMV